MSVDTFLEKKKIGLILRAYVTNESQISNRIEMTSEFIRKTLSVKIKKYGLKD